MAAARRLEDQNNVVLLPPRPHKKAPVESDAVWDACEAVLGYRPKTETEQSMWGKMCWSLTRAGATPDRIHAVAEWYHRHWPDVDLTITAIEKWYSHFLAMAEKKDKKRAAVCPECEIGGGRHAAGCSKIEH